MTLTDMEIDTDLFTVLDFEPAIPCDYLNYGEECPNEAEWVCTSACCGMKIFYCQEHFDELLGVIAEGKDFHHTYGPGACGATGMPKPWSSAERINKSIA